MARLRTLADLRTDLTRLVDLENAATRFGPSELNEYVNKGIAKTYQELITTPDFGFFQKDFSFLCSGANTSPANAIPPRYPLPADYLRLSSCLWAASSSGPWVPLDPYTEAERYQYINAAFDGALWPSKYGIVGGTGAQTQGTIATAYSIEILPPPPSGSSVAIRYVPTCPRLVADTDTFDGILGFEDMAVTWAAILMRRKDDLDTVDLERDLAQHRALVRVVAKRRDGSRPPKVSIVRNRHGGRGRRGGGWGRGGYG